MGVASGCGKQEVGVASGSAWNIWVRLGGDGCWWNLWVWLVGVVVRRYYRFPHITYPYSTCIRSFCSSIPTLLLNDFRSCSSTFL